MPRERHRPGSRRLSQRLAGVVRAVCPPEDLAEELVRATVVETLEMLECLGPGARAVVHAGLGRLELAARVRTGHGFSELDAPRASEMVARLLSGRLRTPVALLRGLVVLAYYEQAGPRERLGYRPDPFIRQRQAERVRRHSGDIARHADLLAAPAPLRPPVGPGGTDRRPGRIVPGGDLTPPTECDVVVVGSGAGGATVAAELAEAGLQVVVLEEGGHHPTATFTTSTTRALRTLYREAGGTATLGRTPIGYAEGRCVGGGTTVNGGMSFRASQRVLERWAALSGDASLADGALAPYYERVERFLSVRLPDPGSVGRDQQLLRVGAERLGWRVVDNLRNHVHCQGCNVCTWGCPTGAKQSTLVSYLPRAVRFGAQVWSDCRVERVVVEDGRAVGVRGRTVAADGREAPFTVRARTVVVSAGAVQTPVLLQRSGVPSASGQVGRNLSLHPGASVGAVFDEQVRGWEGAHQSLQVREFEDDGVVMAAVNLPPSLVAWSLSSVGTELGRVMDDYNQMVTAGVLVEDTGSGRVRSVRGSPVVTYRLSELDRQRVTEAVLRLTDLLFAAGARAVHLPTPGAVPAHTAQDVRRLAAGPLDVSTVHLMGTARIGVDPGWAVCDPFGAVHGTRGLWVADASLFPGPVGTNPMLTIMALATRAAARMIESW